MAIRALDWPCSAAPSILQAWDALAQAAAEPNPFHESWYLLPALRALDPAETVKMLVFEVEGRLCGMLPLRREARYYGKRIAHLANWTHPNCFLGAPLVAPTMERAFWKALLEWADHAGGKGMFLHLSGIPLDGGLHAALAEVLDEQQRGHGLVHREERAMLASDQSPEDYFAASLSGKKRKELRRQLTRLGESGKVAFKREYGADGLDGWLDAFLTLEQAGWKGAAGSALASREDTQALFCGSLAGAAAHGVLERLALTLDGQTDRHAGQLPHPAGRLQLQDRLRRILRPLFARRAVAMREPAAARPGGYRLDRQLRQRRSPDDRPHLARTPRHRPHFHRHRRKTASRRLCPPAQDRTGPQSHRAEAMSTFSGEARALFAASYPEDPHRLPHRLGAHPLLELDALARLAEALPAASIEYNFGDQPIGVDGKPDPTGIPIGETIRNIEKTGSWAVLKNIEQSPEHAALLENLLSEIRPEIEAKTGRMMKTQGFIFISSPGAVTPYHFDPEHNILLQIRGAKTMTQFPAGDAKYAADEVHETYHTGGGRELAWRDQLAGGGREFALGPGDALFVPVMAPHFVHNGPEPSVSLSITWRSEWSFAESDARAFNSVLRRLGMRPKCPGRWPARNRAKAYGWRLLRKLRRGGLAQSPSSRLPSEPSTEPSPRFCPPRLPAAAIIRPASRAKGSDWIHTLPGPRSRAKNTPSPPNSMLLTPPAAITSKSTVGV